MELTWDEENQDKMKAMKDAFNKVDDDDYGKMSHLIGSASESEDDNDDDVNSDNEGESGKNTIDKYRSLLADIHNKERKVDEGNMEVTWNDEDVTEEAQEELTPWEKFLEKKKNKKKMKKVKNDQLEEEDDIPDDIDLSDPFFAEELGEDYVKQMKDKGKKKNKNKKNETSESKDDDANNKDLDLMVMDSDDEKDHFDFKHIVEAETKGVKVVKKKWKKKKKELEVPKDDNFAVDVEDNRFTAMFNRPEFNIDPTNPSFKKTKNMEKIIGEKQKRVSSGSLKTERSLSNQKKQKLDPEVSKALKSVKNKWQKNAVKSNKSKLKFTVKDQ